MPSHTPHVHQFVAACMVTSSAQLRVVEKSSNGCSSTWCGVPASAAATASCVPSVEPVSTTVT